MSIGYDKFPLNFQQILSLDCRRATGTVLDDIAKAHHPTAGIGATFAWIQLASGLWVVDITPATPDYVRILQADSVDMNFTTQAFSFAWWHNLDALGASQYPVARGVDSTDGYSILVGSNGMLYFRTSQATVAQQTTTAAGAVVAGIWEMWVVTRAGAVAKLYKNGSDVISVAGSHINPASAARNFYWGSYDAGGLPCDGKFSLLKCWSGKALSATEVARLFELERAWFGV